MTSHTHDDADAGSILPIVLVIVVVLSMVIVAIADYASTTLRYGQVVEQSADRLASANGALDNALEALERGSSLCALTALPDTGYEYDLLQADAVVATINDINPRVRCRALGASVTGVEEWALVLTGDAGSGARSGPLLTVNGSITPRKAVDGPVFMAQRPNEADSITLLAPLTIQDGDLAYGAASCPAGDVDVTMFPDGTQNLLITPAGYRIRCVPTDDWSTLFAGARPSEAAVPTSAAPPPNVDGYGCTVFEPGRYTSAPALGAYNYFRSGEYVFEDIGEWTISGSYALFGWPGPAGPGIPGKGTDDLADNLCIGAWESDPDQGGATVYLGGNSRLTVGANGSLEVSGRVQGNSFVALQALETAGTPSTVHGDAVPIVDLGGGNNKQIAFDGLVWAPYAAVDLDNVANEAIAALSGGAVVSEIAFQAPNNATNFVIAAGNTPVERRLEFVVSATSPNGATTRVRAVVAYRDRAYAVESRRVLCLTPDEVATSAC